MSEDRHGVGRAGSAPAGSGSTGHRVAARAVHAVAVGAAVGLLAAAESVIGAERLGRGGRELDGLVDAALWFAMAGTIAGWRSAGEQPAAEESAPGCQLVGGDRR